ncbi:MAG: AraC family transcriptional regulator [Planctomycetes bacterium]|nr:AraC family transcriptional regulator [Planctomycetota bacterium]
MAKAWRHYGPRLEYHLTLSHQHENPLPEFPALTHVHYAHCAPTHDLAPHQHPIYELCYIHSGRGAWWAENHAYKLKPGDLYITKPGEVHGGKTDSADPLVLYVCGIDPGALPLARIPKPALPGPEGDVGQAYQQTRSLDDDFRALDLRVIPNAQGIETIYKRLLAELDQHHEPGTPGRALRLMMVQAMLVELLVFVARRYAEHRRTIGPALPVPAPANARFLEVQAWARSRLSDPPALADLADRAGLSPAHFAVLFKQETGETPLEFVTRARIEDAARLLRARPDAGVTSVALDLGFSSSQYFSLVFKKVMGCTPSEWQEGKGGGAA